MRDKKENRSEQRRRHGGEEHKQDAAWEASAFLEGSMILAATVIVDLTTPFRLPVGLGLISFGEGPLSQDRRGDLMWPAARLNCSGSLLGGGAYAG
jgi:hypothetical protein